jgi:uncharacterized repeat protein (TIGR04052 family)
MRPTLLCLLIGLFAACAKPPIVVSIPFTAQFGAESLTCAEQNGAIQLTDLRFYVQDVQLITVDGDAVNVTLNPDDTWQQRDLALLDLEDGSGSCLNGSSETNETLRGTVPDGEYRGLTFIVGVPFERNHADPLQAKAPLGDAAMHWHWRAGYKFMRAGIRTADDGFWLHLGSTGCEGTVRNITACNSENRVRVVLTNFVLDRDAVVVDLAALTSGTNLDDAMPTDCSSGPAEAACAEPFRALGLEFPTGESASEQELFRLEEVQ